MTKGQRTEGQRDPETPETPGEFAIEDELDPVRKALKDLDDLDEPTLFDREHEIADPGVALDTGSISDAEARPFAAEFQEEEEEEEEEAERTEEPRIVARGDRAVEEPVYAAEEPMFAAPEPAPDHHDVQEPSGFAFLPVAVTAVLCLLIGFAAGYFLGSRDRLVPASEAAQTTAPQAAPAATGAATPEKPGQYSEAKVTPPVPTVTEAAAGAAALRPGSGQAAAPAPAPAPATPPPAAAAPAVPSRVEGPVPSERQRVEGRPERAAKTGQLVVKSTPSRAGVTVNGTWRGRTPLTLDTLPFGSYVVRIVEPGFQVAREEVTLNAREASHTFEVRLQRAARSPSDATPPSQEAPPAALTGLLYVDSRPRGANVLIDGKRVGQTPLNLPDVPVGSHVVVIEMAGKKTWTATSLVTAGKMARVTGSLEDK